MGSPVPIHGGDIEEELCTRPRRVPNDHCLLEAAPYAGERRSVRVEDEEHARGAFERLVERGLPRVRGDVGPQLVLVIRVRTLGGLTGK